MKKSRIPDTVRRTKRGLTPKDIHEHKLKSAFTTSNFLVNMVYLCESDDKFQSPMARKCIRYLAKGRFAHSEQYLKKLAKSTSKFDNFLATFIDIEISIYTKRNTRYQNFEPITLLGILARTKSIMPEPFLALCQFRYLELTQQHLHEIEVQKLPSTLDIIDGLIVQLSKETMNLLNKEMMTTKLHLWAGKCCLRLGQIEMAKKHFANNLNCDASKIYLGITHIKHPGLDDPVRDMEQGIQEILPFTSNRPGLLPLIALTYKKIQGNVHQIENKEKYLKLERTILLNLLSSRLSLPQSQEITCQNRIQEIDSVLAKAPYSSSISSLRKRKANTSHVLLEDTESTKVQRRQKRHKS